MANSANPEINKKIATSALGTLVIATVFFYLGDRYAETLVTYPGQIFDHLRNMDAFVFVSGRKIEALEDLSGLPLAKNCSGLDIDRILQRPKCLG